MVHYHYCSDHKYIIILIYNYFGRIFDGTYNGSFIYATENLFHSMLLNWRKAQIIFG